MENGLLKAKGQIATCLRAKSGVIWIQTVEEFRAERAIFEIAAEMDFGVKVWSVSRGLELIDFKEKNVDGSITISAIPSMSTVRDPMYPYDALKDAYEAKGRWITIMRDLGSQQDPVTIRAIRDASRFTAGLPQQEAKAVIVIDQSKPKFDIPELTIVDLPLPGKESVQKIIDSAIKSLGEKLDTAKIEKNKDEIIAAAIGIPSEQISISILKSFIDTKTIDPSYISREKKQIVAKKGVLEWYDPDPKGFDLIGGLESLKKWLIQRKAGFSSSARDYGLPIPKGLMMVGVPGCGKSLSAKCTAAAWGIPLLRLDMGSIFGGVVGESESNVREALNVAETASPCILWADEIEKGVAGSVSGAASDGGTASRVFATLLTWLQEKTAPVFVIATANSIKDLPPEFLRAGRWDDIFFVDLPSRSERVAICEIFKNKYKATKDVSPEKIAEYSNEYSGAEIEAAWTGAMYCSFQEGCRPTSTLDVIQQLGLIVPQSKSQADKIKALRDWANGNARKASVSSKDEELKMRGRLD